MWLYSYGPGRYRKKAVGSGDSRVRETQRLLAGWGRPAVAMNEARSIIREQEAASGNDRRKHEGALPGE